MWKNMTLIQNKKYREWFMWKDMTLIQNKNIESGLCGKT